MIKNSINISKPNGFFFHLKSLNMKKRPLYNNVVNSGPQVEAQTST